LRGLIELAARDLGIDSAEMRRRKLIGAGEMPYRLPRLEPGGPALDTECDSGDYRETLECCLAEFDWEEKRARQGREVGGRYHGVRATSALGHFRLSRPASGAAGQPQ
jgi:carbon-monoxide dehydrogenase large subunit